MCRVLSTGKHALQRITLKHAATSGVDAVAAAALKPLFGFGSVPVEIQQHAPEQLMGVGPPPPHVMILSSQDCSLRFANRSPM